MSNFARRSSYPPHLALLALAAGACGGEDRAPTKAATPEETIEQMAAAYPSFTKMNGRTFPTAQHEGNAHVNVWANAVAATTYGAIDPSVSPVALPAFVEGSMLVKEMLDPAGVTRS